MTKQATNAGRVGVAPSLDLIRCAGCGAALPAGERCPECGGALPCLKHYALKTRDDLRCDLCWRSMLAAEAAQWRQEHNGALTPWFDLVIRGVLTP